MAAACLQVAVFASIGRIRTVATSKAQKKLGGPKVGGDGPRQAKVDAVAEVEEKVGSSSAVVLTEYRGLTVDELAELRAGLRKANAEYRVYKNTLAKIATGKLGLTELDEHLEGPTAFAFALSDPVEAAKALLDFAKKAPALVVKGGILDGKVLAPDQIKELGELDSREVMLAKAAGMFVTPIQSAANLFQAGFNQLGGLLVQLRDKLPAEEAPAEPAAEAAPESTEGSAEVADAPATDTPGDEGAPSEGEGTSETNDETPEG